MGDRCTCRSGRDYDGSEFGPCEACERASDEERITAGMMTDAARWRISRVVYHRSMDEPYGYFAIAGAPYGPFSVGIQPHPVTKQAAVNACILGEGATESEAIDSMFLALDALERDHVLPPEIEGPRAMAAAGRLLREGGRSDG